LPCEVEKGKEEAKEGGRGKRQGKGEEREE